MDHAASNALGSYLRARRHLLRPSDVGLPTTRRRRVPGLRREEVATLAGISVDYYLGLEQGRDRRPSADILRALAAALQLDRTATAYLFTLATPEGHVPDVPGNAEVSPVLRRMIDSWPVTPAYVQDRTFTVRAANSLARLLSPAFAPGVNLVRTLFLDAGSMEIDPDPRPNFVACLRGLSRAEVTDQKLVALVDELSEKSEQFRILWGRHDVGGDTSGSMTLHNSPVGAITLDFERLSVPSAPELQLVVCSASPDSPSSNALQKLTELLPR